MAEKQIYIDEEHNKNYINNAKTTTQLVESDDDIINRKYVDDGDLFNTTLSQTVNTVYAVGGIQPNTDINNKKVVEVLDDIFYPLKSPLYTLPTATLTVNTDDIVNVVGFKTDILLTANVTLNDSQSVISYTFSGSGIAQTSITQTTPTLLISDYIMNDVNYWVVDINYSGALIKQDTHGNDDNTGIFTSDYLFKQVSIDAKYPNKYGVIYDDKDITTATNTTINDFLTTNILEDKFTIEVGKNKIASLNIAIQGDKYIKVKMNELDVTNSFKRSVISNAPTDTNLLNTTYSVFNHYTPQLNNNTKFDIEVIDDINLKISSLVYNYVDNTIIIDSGIVLQAWNTTTNNPITANEFSVYYNNGVIKIVSNFDTMKKIILGHPINNYELNSNNYDITNIKGLNQHLELNNDFKFLIYTI